MTTPPNTREDPIWLTISEAASEAGVTQRTIRRWIVGHGLTTRHHQGRVYLDLAEVNQCEAATRRSDGWPRLWDKRRSMS